MKKICQFICICAVFVIFVNASVWEGAAVAASGTELPETGLYIATNSFPANTVVDVTNLENGKTIQVIVSSGLDTPGLLAVLSRDAAGAIDLPGRSLGRIRMTQPADTIAFSRFAEGIGSGDPDYDPAAFVALNGQDLSAVETAAAEEGNVPPENGRIESGDLIVDMPVEETPSAPVIPVVVVDDPAEDKTEIADVSPAPVAAEEAVPPAEPKTELAETPAEDTSAAEAAPPVEPKAELTEAPSDAHPVVPFVPAVIHDDSIVPEKKPEVVEAIPETSVSEDPKTVPEPEYDLALLPAETRPPEKGPEPDPSYVIPGIGPAPEAPPRTSSDYIDPSLIIDPAKEAPLAQHSPLPPADVVPVLPPAAAPIQSFSPAAAGPVFSAPLISSLEKGKYYLQIAAYSKAEIVQSEIAKIDNKLPLAIMNTGSADKPLYRILIGPVNLGESGALLQRFKGTHKDAFVRLGT